MTSPSLLILGTDAVLAAMPATAVQLAHACLAAGYRSVVPASWGDEIIADRVLEAVKNVNGPLVLCACPFVARRLNRHDDDLGSMVLTTASPPVATAAYLRALYAPASVRVTYAGGCPSGGDAAIDAWLTPEELLADLAGKGIQLSLQPTEFDSVLPPDRRRHYSEAGGIPSPDALQRSGVELAKIQGDDFAIELAQQLLARDRRLVDSAPALGCLCSGVLPGIPPCEARTRVHAHEPPRAPAPVVDHELDLPVVVVKRGDGIEPPALHAEHRAGQVVVPPASSPRGAASAVSVENSVEIDATATAGVVAASIQETSRRRSPHGTNRAIIGAMPQARSAGRQLPRAYVARRRSSPKGIRQSGVRRQIDIVDPFHQERASKLPWVAAAAALIAVLALVLLWWR